MLRFCLTIFYHIFFFFSFLIGSRHVQVLSLYCIHISRRGVTLYLLGFQYQLRTMHYSHPVSVGPKSQPQQMEVVSSIQIFPRSTLLNFSVRTGPQRDKEVGIFKEWTERKISFSFHDRLFSFSIIYWVFPSFFFFCHCPPDIHSNDCYFSSRGNNFFSPHSYKFIQIFWNFSYRKKWEVYN